MCGAVYHPEHGMGRLLDYYGFGTEEFIGLCRKLNTEPLIVLPATSTAPGRSSTPWTGSTT